MENNIRIKGKITKVHEKGWGFIISEEMKFTKFFFYWQSLNQGTKNFTELKPGMEVMFTPLTDKFVDRNGKEKGPRAIKIDVL